ncbi:MAG TPA: hypothetical protein VML96_05770 [Egibacteraceae bacterium]|nr:hypothetical protein [Egibacteraceae bacterium]
MRNLVLDLLLPMRCPACAVPSEDPLCPRCLATASALALPGYGREVLNDDVVAIGAYAYDGVIRDAVRAMKARGQHAAAAGLGALMRRQLDLPAIRRGWAVTWVPSSRRRLRQRGVELTKLLAGPSAVALLQRVVDRPDQTDLNAAQRRSSPIGAFRALGTSPPAVLLVDDVRTTGATALDAAEALKQAGARRVLVATLAVGGDQARRSGQARTPNTQLRSGSATGD